MVAGNKEREQGSREVPFVRRLVLKQGAFCSKRAVHVNVNGNVEGNIGEGESRGVQSKCFGQ